MEDNKDLRTKAERVILTVLGALAVGLTGTALILALSGCASAKPVVMERVTRDTVRTVVRDTVWQDRFVERIVERVKREATSVRDSTVRTVDKDGNVVKEEHWRGEKTRESSEETELYKDSAAMWKARYAAVLRAREDTDKTVSHPTEAKARPWWKTMGDVYTYVLLIFIGVGLARLWEKKK